MLRGFGLLQECAEKLHDPANGVNSVVGPVSLFSCSHLVAARTSMQYTTCCPSLVATEVNLWVPVRWEDHYLLLSCFHVNIQSATGCFHLSIARIHYSPKCFRSVLTDSSGEQLLRGATDIRRKYKLNGHIHAAWSIGVRAIACYVGYWM